MSSFYEEVKRRAAQNFYEQEPDSVEPQYSDADIDGFMGQFGFKPKQPNPETQNNGFLESIKDGWDSGAAGVIGGVADFVGADKVGNYFNDVVTNNRRNKEFDTVFSLDYVTDPQGLAYDVGNQLGSMTALAPAAAAAAYAMPASVPAAAAGLFGRVATRVGAEKAAQYFASEAGKKAIQVFMSGSATAFPESLSEGGSSKREGLANGMTEDEANDAKWDIFLKNFPTLALSNGLEYALLGGKIFNPAGKAGESIAQRVAKAPIRSVPAVAANGIQNAAEELLQTTYTDQALGRPVGNVLNPSQWTDSQRQSFEVGLVGSAIIGAGASGYHSMQTRPNGDMNSDEQNTSAKSDNPIGSDANSGINMPEDNINPTQSTSSNIVDNVRNLIGKIPYVAEDGTNCMRTLGIALQGTPFEGQINVDQAVATAQENGLLKDPSNYKPQAGDMAVVNDGNHIVMVTENGGTIQNGQSRNGVYEDGSSPEAMFGGVKYYIQSSVYNNGNGTNQATYNAQSNQGDLTTATQFLQDNQYTFDADTNNTIADALESKRPESIVELYKRLNPDTQKVAAGTNTSASTENRNMDNPVRYNNDNKQDEYNPLQLQTHLGNIINKVKAGQGAKPIMSKQGGITVGRSSALENKLRESTLFDMTKRAFNGDQQALQNFYKLRPDVQETLKRMTGMETPPIGAREFSPTDVGMHLVRNAISNKQPQEPIPADNGTRKRGFIPEGYYDNRQKFLDESLAIDEQRRSINYVTDAGERLLSEQRSADIESLNQSRASEWAKMEQEAHDAKLLSKALTDPKMLTTAQKAINGNDASIKTLSKVRPDIRKALISKVSGVPVESMNLGAKKETLPIINNNDSANVSFYQEGLTEHSRPSSEQKASQLNAKLDPYGNDNLSQRTDVVNNDTNNEVSVKENIERGKAALTKVINEKTDVENAMYRNDVGSIDFIFGYEGKSAPKFKGGYGISHIVAKRDYESGDGLRVAEKLVVVLAKGSLSNTQDAENGTRVHIEHEGHTAILSLFRDGKKQSWLLTGWENRKEATNADAEVYDSDNATSDKTTRFHSARDVASIDTNLSQNQKEVNNAIPNKKTTNAIDGKGGEMALADGYSTESGLPLNEAGEREFIVKPDGSIDFGEITSDIEQATNGVLKAGKIRLQVGNKDFGLVHIKKREGDLPKIGFKSAEDFIGYIANGYEDIYSSDKRDKRFILVKDGNKHGFMPLDMELTYDGQTYYAVVTAIPMKTSKLNKQIKKGTLIYSKRPNLAANSNVGVVPNENNSNVGVASPWAMTTKSDVPFLDTNLSQNQKEVNNKKTTNAIDGEGGEIALADGYSTESGLPLNEAGEREFIVKPDGSIDFGEISQDVAHKTNGRLENAPIRLQVGNSQFGLRHVLKHLDQIKSKGFDEPLSFISHIINNFTQIYDQSSKMKPNRFVLYVQDKSKGFMPLDLELESSNGQYYTIVSAMPHKEKIKGTLIYDGSARPSAATTNGQLSAEDNNKGGVTSAIVHAKTSLPIGNNLSQNQAEVNNKADAPSKIEDFGEKIGGARKDIYSDYLSSFEKTGDSYLLDNPLSKSWPHPDYQKMLDEGVDKAVVDLVRSLRDSVKSKPRSRYSNMDRWLAETKALRNATQEVLTSNSPTISADVLVDKTVREQVLSRAKLYASVGHDSSLAGLSFTSHLTESFHGERFAHPKRMWRINAPTFSDFTAIYADSEFELIEKFKTEYTKVMAQRAKEHETFLAKKSADEERIAQLKKDGWEPSKTVADIPDSVKKQFGVYREKVGDKVLDGFYIGVKPQGAYSKPVVIKDGFETSSEAFDYRRNNMPELVETLKAMKELPAEYRDTNSSRIGEDVRKGKDVTPELFGNTFGFRGVEFGNWVKNDRRQADLNAAYDALMDLAGVLGISPKALSLNGELGLAFGARGKGGKHSFNAHYESGLVVINLTKERGAGSLAHEWWHAVDNYFSRMQGDSAGLMLNDADVNKSSTERLTVPKSDKVRREMITAFGDVLKAINNTELPNRAEKLDNFRKKSYWATNHELGARAFSSYVIDKLKDNRASNDYLANVRTLDEWVAASGNEENYPFPTRAELPTIKAAFDKFFNTVKEKETDKGVAMYSARDKSDSDNQPATSEKLSADEKAWADNLDKIFNGTFTHNSAIKMMQTPLVLKNVGLDNLPIVMHPSKLKKILKEHPEMSPDVLKQIPSHIADPMAVFKSDTVGGRIVVALELTDAKGANVVVPIELSKTADEYDANIATSAYGKLNFSKTGVSIKWFKDRFEGENSTPLYLNNKKITSWYLSNRLQLPYGKYQSGDFFANTIPNENDLVKLQRQNPDEYSVKQNSAGNALTVDELVKIAKESIPNAKNISVEGDTVSLEFPNGRRLIIDLVDEILATPDELAKASKDHGISVTSNKQLQGSMRIVGLDGIMQLTRDSEVGTIDHEVMELAKEVALTEKEKSDLDRIIPNKEKQCDEYREWQKLREEGRGSRFGKLWQRIQDFATHIKALFGNIDAKRDLIFEKIASGEVWNRDIEGNPKLGADLLHEDTAKWQKLCDTYNADKATWDRKNSGAIFDFMKMPLVLQLIGAKDLNLQVYGSFFTHAIRPEHPGMDIDILKQLPPKVADPLMIFKTQNPNKFVLTLELVDNNKATVVVPVELEKVDGRHGVIRVVNSAYGRVSMDDNKTPNYEWFGRNLSKGNLVYVNKKKSTDWVQAIRKEFPVGFTLLNRALLNPSIKTDVDLVKLKMQYPEQYSVSNVNEQELTIRADAFKSWFGDWENDQKNSSKVVNESGKPLVVYHGTNANEDFSSFDMYGSNFGLFGQGAYFTENEQVAKDYQLKGKGANPRTYKVFLKIINPLDMDSKANIAAWRNVSKNTELNPDFRDVVSNKDAYSAVLESLEYDGYTKNEALELMYDFVSQMGYDGVTHIGGGRIKSDTTKHRVWIAFEPEQIKSVDNTGAFNASSSNIYYSIRSDHNNFQDNKAISDNGHNKEVKKTYDFSNNFSIDKSDIKRFVSAVLQDPQKKLRLVLGKVSDSEAQDILEATGIDVKGYTHIWRSNDVKHVGSRHGINTEKNHAQKGLNQDDMVAALEAISSPEKIEKGSTTNNGEPSIRFIKNDSDGEFTVVEVVRENSKTLAIKTMWKKIANKHHGDSALLDTSETAIDKSSSTFSENIPPKSDDVKYSIRSATENLSKNLKDMAGSKKDERIEIKETKKPKSAQFGMIDHLLRSPSYLAERFPQLKGFFRFAEKAMQVQEKLRSDFDRGMKRVYGHLKNKDEHSIWQSLLWSGDTVGKDYSRSELEQEGYSENVIKAYLQTRELIKKAYHLLNDARKKVTQHQKVLTKNKLDELRNNIFAEIVKVEERGDGEYIVVWKEQKTWLNEYTVSKEVLEDMKNGTSHYLGEPANKSQIISIKPDGKGEYIIKTREGLRDISNRAGYIPHFFHDFFVLKKSDSGKVNEKGESIYDYAVVGSGRTISDAYAKAEKYLIDNPDVSLVIQPKAFKFENDESTRAAIIGDTEYKVVMDRISRDMEMTPAQVRDMLDGKLKVKGRRRFFGNLLQRKGAEGFESDMDWVLRHYFNATSRYVALEEFKPAAIGLFERYFGRFDNDYTNNPIANYAKQYINDINGNPSLIENYVNNFLNNSKWFRKHIASNFGDRAALQLASTITGGVSILKLGFFNISSALLNLSQLMNTVGLLGAFSPVAGGMKNAIRPGIKEMRIFKETGIMNDITMDTTSGYNRFSPRNVFGKTMYLFRTMDMYARQATVLAAYHKAQIDGKNHAESIAFAKEVNRKSNFSYGVEDAPNIFRRGSIFSQIALQFKKYPIKELELMYEITSKGTVAQKAKFWGTYFLLCGLLQIPMLDWLDDIFKELFDESPKLAAKKWIMDAAGSDPMGKELARIAIYGIGAAANVDISGRAGVGDVSFSADKGISGMLGGASYSTVEQGAKAIAGFIKGEGSILPVAKALSPAMANYIQAGMGYTEGKRGRKNTDLDNAYDAVLKATGFRNVEESVVGDKQQIFNNEKSEHSKARQRVMDMVLTKQANKEKITPDDVKELGRLGITGKQLDAERKKKRMSAKERLENSLSDRDKVKYRGILQF